MPESSVTIVIPGDDPAQIQGSPHLDGLKKHGNVVLYEDRPSSVEEQVKRAIDADCLINTRSSVKWRAEILSQLPRLKMITVCGIGTDAIDLEMAKEKGIVVCNLPGKTAPIVAEHAFGLMFALAKRAWFQTEELMQGRWTRMDNIYLRGKTIGVIGTGNIGAEMIKLASAIGMNVIAWTFHPSTERATKLGVEFVDLDDLIRKSDVISIHVRLTEQTRGLIGEKELALMKQGALLVNTARGDVTDTTALVAALKSGHLGGAAVDVFDREPIPPDHPLLSCEQVVLTPHNADQTPEGMEILNKGVVDNVIAFLKGSPQNRVV